MDNRHYRNWVVYRQEAKPFQHTAKHLPSTAHSKASTAVWLTAKRTLSCAFYHTHGKEFCSVFGVAHEKKATNSAGQMTAPADSRQTSQGQLCRVPGRRHTTKFAGGTRQSAIQNGQKWSLCRVPCRRHTAKCCPEWIEMVTSLCFVQEAHDELTKQSLFLLFFHV